MLNCGRTRSWLTGQLWVWLLLAVLPGAAQAPPASGLHGTVFDPSNAAIPQATVHVHGSEEDQEVVTDGMGRYVVPLRPGAYDVTVEAEGFRTFSKQTVQVSANGSLLNVVLAVAAADEQVDVLPDNEVSTDASANRSALVFQREQLETLSDDPAVMQQQLQMLSGGDPSSPSQTYVDGFSNGTLPAKESIREIRINQNPFTAQFDKFGLGRIEIFTKPGADKLHGSLESSFGGSAVDARNPYVSVRPDYVYNYTSAVLNGPLGKRTSFYLTGQRRDVPASAIINATVLDAGLEVRKLSQAIGNRILQEIYSGRIDRQIGRQDTGMVRYTYSNIAQPNLGTGQLVLFSQASASNLRTHTLQAMNTHIFNAHITLESALQFIRTRRRQLAQSMAPTVVVQGSFSGGGSPSQALQDNQDNLELRSYLSIAHGAHFLRTGMRYRLMRDANYSTANFNGQFVFPSLTAFQITQQGLRQGKTDSQIRATCVTGTDGTSTCGGASLFSLATGDPRATVMTGDLSVYAEDEWKIKPVLSVNYGMRIESQSRIPGQFDLAPRLGFAYSVKRAKAKSPLFVVRGGFGLFFTRFDVGYLLQSRRQNGITQVVRYLRNPIYTCAATVSYPCLTPDLSQVGSLGQALPTVYEISPRLRSPIQMQGLVTVERSLGKYGSLAVNYYHLRTTHLYNSFNVNTPDPATGRRPIAGAQDIYQYASQGTAKWYLFSSNLNLNLGKKLNTWTYASMGKRTATAFGPDQFASNYYNLGADIGPPPGYSPQEFTSGINFHPFWELNLTVLTAVRGRTPYNITTGKDNNGDSIYNDRPSFATDLTRNSVVRTSYGNFDTDPQPGQTIIPYGFGRTARYVYTEMYLVKTIHLGHVEGTGGGKPVKPYRLQVAFGAENVFNHVNAGVPVGVLSSPLFGQAISLNTPISRNNGANRSLSFQTSFSF